MVLGVQKAKRYGIVCAATAQLGADLVHAINLAYLSMWASFTMYVMGYILILHA